MDNEVNAIIESIDINEYRSKENKYVITVDDDEFQLKCLTNRLEKQGIKCLKCKNGEECLFFVKKINNQNKTAKIIILCDIDMPKMNGLEMAKAINDFYNLKNFNVKNLNIVYISSDIENGKLNDNLKKFDINFSFIKYFYSKPITNKILINIIEEFIQ